MKSSSMGRTLSITSMIGCMALAVPAALMGVVARATDWNLVEGYNRTISRDNGNAILPLVLRLLTPQWVSFIGKLPIENHIISYLYSFKILNMSIIYVQKKYT